MTTPGEQAAEVFKNEFLPLLEEAKRTLDEDDYFRFLVLTIGYLDQIARETKGDNGHESLNL